MKQRLTQLYTAKPRDEYILDKMDSSYYTQSQSLGYEMSQHPNMDGEGQVWVLLDKAYLRIEALEKAIVDMCTMIESNQTDTLAYIDEVLGEEE